MTPSPTLDRDRAPARLRWALVFAVGASMWGGCAPETKVYPGPDRPKDQIATLVLAAQQGGHLVRIDAAARVESVRWFDEQYRDREWFNFLALPGIGDARATHVLRAARIDTVDGENVHHSAALYPADADGVGPSHGRGRLGTWFAHGVVQILPGVHDIQGTIPFPCWNGYESAPTPRPFALSLKVEPGRQYVVGSLQPTVPLATPPWYQPVVIGNDDTKKSLGYVRYMASVVPCPG